MRRPEIERLLPTVYQLAIDPVEDWLIEPDRRLGAVLDAMETLHDPIEQILNALEAWLNPRRAPEPFVPYLAGWVDLDRMTSLDPVAPGARRVGGAPARDALTMAAATVGRDARVGAITVARAGRLGSGAGEVAWHPARAAPVPADGHGHDGVRGGRGAALAGRATAAVPLRASRSGGGGGAAAAD